MPLDLNILDIIQHDIHLDIFAQQVLDHIHLEYARAQLLAKLYIDHKKFMWHDGILYYNGILCVPNGSAHLKVLELCHNTYMIGHFRIHKTLELVTP